MKALPTIIALACTGVLAGGWALSSPVHGATPRAAAAYASDSAEDRRLASRARGSSAAPLTVYELSDFQCTFCRRFVLETYPQLEERYIRTGKVRWVFLNRPKPEKHPNSVRAAEFAVCAGRQGRFWPMHDHLFEAQSQWADLARPDSVFRALATASGVSATRLARCLASGEAHPDIAADTAYAGRWGVGGVPAFNIGGAVLLGARPAERFIAVIDSVLAQRAAACSLTCGN
jgi:protein-disulfide isomerase